MKELAKFYQYKEICGDIVAEFQVGLHKFVINHENCKDRLEYLKEGGWPCDQTQFAINNWPVEKTRH